MHGLGNFYPILEVFFRFNLPNFADDLSALLCIIFCPFGMKIALGVLKEHGSRQSRVDRLFAKLIENTELFVNLSTIFSENLMNIIGVLVAVQYTGHTYR